MIEKKQVKYGRQSPILWQKVELAAQEEGITISEWITKALTSRLRSRLYKKLKG